MSTMLIEVVGIYLPLEDTSRDFFQSEICLPSSDFWVEQEKMQLVYGCWGISFFGHALSNRHCGSSAEAGEEETGYLVRKILIWADLFS